MIQADLSKDHYFGALLEDIQSQIIRLAEAMAVVKDDIQQIKSDLRIIKQDLQEIKLIKTANLN